MRLSLNEELVAYVDALAAKLGISRSAFIRDVLRDALLRRRELIKEARHRAGYRKKPVGQQEFLSFQSVQVWPHE